MSKIKSKDSKAELLLRRSLFHMNIRYRIHNKKITGKPDISISKYKIAIFVDGDWWHGRNYDREHLKYPNFWQDKILKNMQRDQAVNEKLENEDWTVLRFWQKDIEKDTSEVAIKIYNKIEQRRKYGFNRNQKNNK